MMRRTVFLRPLTGTARRKVNNYMLCSKLQQHQQQRCWFSRNSNTNSAPSSSKQTPNTSTTGTSSSIIHPYSESLPSPGYEWCTRCNIRTHKFQKPVEGYNPCLDRPRLFGLGICQPAKHYYRNQVLYMMFTCLLCFAVAAEMEVEESSASSVGSNPDEIKTQFHNHQHNTTSQDDVTMTRGEVCWRME